MKKATINNMTVKHAEEMSKLKCLCTNCGHKEIIPVFVDKKICSYCGNVVQNNSLLHFKYKMRKEIQNGR